MRVRSAVLSVKLFFNQYESVKGLEKLHSGTVFLLNLHQSVLDVLINMFR